MIFETERLIVRKLLLLDLHPFHEMQSNPLVMEYATGDPKNIQENEEEINRLIEKYDKKG